MVYITTYKPPQSHPNATPKPGTSMIQAGVIRDWWEAGNAQIGVHLKALQTLAHLPGALRSKAGDEKRPCTACGLPGQMLLASRWSAAHAKRAAEEQAALNQPTTKSSATDID